MTCLAMRRDREEILGPNEVVGQTQTTLGYKIVVVLRNYRKIGTSFCK